VQNEHRVGHGWRHSEGVRVVVAGEGERYPTTNATCEQGQVGKTLQGEVHAARGCESDKEGPSR
jgi:hypothetical protein